MSDLINRLRGQYQVGPDGIYGTRSFADFIPLISLEAADRIEELEQQLKTCRNNALDEAIKVVNTLSREPNGCSYATLEKELEWLKDE